MKNGQMGPLPLFPCGCHSRVTRIMVEALLMKIRQKIPLLYNQHNWEKSDQREMWELVSFVATFDNDLVWVDLDKAKMSLAIVRDKQLHKHHPCLFLRLEQQDLCVGKTNSFCSICSSSLVADNSFAEWQMRMLTDRPSRSSRHVDLRTAHPTDADTEC